MTRRVVRERIDPRLTASLFANYRSAIDALLELVDNAVDSRQPGRPLRVDLVIRPESIEMTVIGGMGMGPAELERDYLRWGASRKWAGDRIGRYGQGGKAAIGHLGNRFDEAVRMPRPPRTAGKGAGRGVGEVVVRALDPRLRSAMVIEDGVRRIVINSKYPLYEVRRGDLWYQLETALREVCVTIPEATVPEFERKVNELMLVSLTLTGTRKRRRSRPVVRQTKGAWAG